MDPTVQVALIGVIATLITTIGVVATAVINGLHIRVRDAEKVMSHYVDEDGDEIMPKILALITENERKESIISSTQREISKLHREIRQLKAENTLLRLELRELKPG